jgi:hypothetical protein
MDEMKSPIKEAKERLEPIWWFVRVFRHNCAGSCNRR